MQSPFRNIGIFGIGLIGGSLGLAIKRSDPQIHILGIGRDAGRLRIAQHMGVVDSFVTEIGDSLRDLNLLILATPIESIIEVLGRIGPHLSPGAVVSDVGSTKRRICGEAWRQLPGYVEFIGGHPVAGREVTGVEHSIADLFERAPYVLCKRPEAAQDNLESLRQLVEKLGARPVIMTAEEHDRTMAWVSHLPQLVSTALANLSGKERFDISGSGFRDMTRLAGSSYSVWKGIVDTNGDNIDSALKAFALHLDEIRTSLSDAGLAEEFDGAAEVYRKSRS